MFSSFNFFCKVFFLKINAFRIIAFKLLMNFQGEKQNRKNHSRKNLNRRMVCIYVAGLLLLVVGGVVVQSDETDRVWSEALLLLHVAVAISN